MTPTLAYLLATNQLTSLPNGEPDMDLTELLQAFETKVTDVQTATATKTAAQEALVLAQEAVAAANASLTSEKGAARAALDAVIAKLNEIAEGLGI